MVYGIFSGQYSDWTCHGYFEMESSAKAYCKAKNKSKSEWEGDYYILVLHNLTEGADRESKKAYMYFAEDGRVERAKYEDDGILKGDSPYVISNRWYPDPGDEKVVVYVSDDEVYKVPKIAQDAIAKYWARREGL